MKILFASFLLYLLSGSLILKKDYSDTVIVDSNYSFSEATEGKEIPGNVINNLVLVEVEYYSFDQKLHRGQLLVHKKVQKDIVEIFNLIKEKKFPVSKVIPVVKYDWNDEKSMRDNNTSSFNYRLVKGTSVVSAHSSGKAVDINPLLNPQFINGKVVPAGAKYDPAKPGTLTRDSFIVKEFRKRGWQWGGMWRRTKDYQHFEKK